MASSFQSDSKHLFTIPLLCGSLVRQTQKVSPLLILEDNS